jgi:hypothetical protein
VLDWYWYGVGVGRASAATGRSAENGWIELGGSDIGLWSRLFATDTVILDTLKSFWLDEGAPMFHLS